jgi:hypothetical protein
MGNLFQGYITNMDNTKHLAFSDTEGSEAEILAMHLSAFILKALKNLHS